MNREGFAFPDDIPLLLTVGALSLYYFIRLRLVPLDRLLQGITERNGSSLPFIIRRTIADHELDKVWRAISFVLLRLLKTSTPCLCRALTMHHCFAGRTSSVSVRIGVRKEGEQLQSHAWVVVNGKPFRESPTDLAQYTILLEK